MLIGDSSYCSGRDLRVCLRVCVFCEWSFAISKSRFVFMWALAVDFCKRQRPSCSSNEESTCCVQLNFYRHGQRPEGHKSRGYADFIITRISFVCSVYADHKGTQCGQAITTPRAFTRMRYLELLLAQQMSTTIVRVSSMLYITLWSFGLICTFCKGWLLQIGKNL